jgi:hypothetical protein
LTIADSKAARLVKACRWRSGRVAVAEGCAPLGGSAGEELGRFRRSRRAAVETGKRPTIAAWQERFRHIAADEFRTSTRRYRLLCLSRTDNNLCVIGDPNQAIGCAGAIFRPPCQDFQGPTMGSPSTARPASSRQRKADRCEAPAKASPDAEDHPRCADRLVSELV